MRVVYKYPFTLNMKFELDRLLAGGEITIATCLEGDVVHVQVRDEGIGIPSTALETIFDIWPLVALLFGLK